MNTVGCKRWAIAEGYIPSQSHGPEPELESHETCCILNAGDSQARIAITIYFEDREPVGPYTAVVDARRTLHLRFNSPASSPWRTLGATGREVWPRPAQLRRRRHPDHRRRDRQQQNLSQMMVSARIVLADGR